MTAVFQVSVSISTFLVVKAAPGEGGPTSRKIRRQQLCRSHVSWPCQSSTIGLVELQQSPPLVLRCLLEYGVLFHQPVKLLPKDLIGVQDLS